MKNKLIVKDEKEYLALKRKDLAKRVNKLVEQGIRVVRCQGTLVDAISVKGEKLRNSKKKSVIALAEEVISLQKRERKLKKIKKDEK